MPKRFCYLIFSYKGVRFFTERNPTAYIVESAYTLDKKQHLSVYHTLRLTPNSRDLLSRPLPDELHNLSVDCRIDVTVSTTDIHAHFTVLSTDHDSEAIALLREITVVDVAGFGLKELPLYTSDVSCEGNRDGYAV